MLGWADQIASAVNEKDWQGSFGDTQSGGELILVFILEVRWPRLFVRMGSLGGKNQGFSASSVLAIGLFGFAAVLAGREAELRRVALPSWSMVTRETNEITIS